MKRARAPYNPRQLVTSGIGAVRIEHDKRQHGLLDPAARELYVDWDEATEVAVSGLREVADIDMGSAPTR
jgi:hypothetical protein